MYAPYRSPLSAPVRGILVYQAHLPARVTLLRPPARCPFRPRLRKRHIRLQHRPATRSATFPALGHRWQFLSPLFGQILTGKPPSRSMETLTSMACAKRGPVGLRLDEALTALLSRVYAAGVDIGSILFQDFGVVSRRRFMPCLSLLL